MYNRYLSNFKYYLFNNTDLCNSKWNFSLTVESQMRTYLQGCRCGLGNTTAIGWIILLLIISCKGYRMVTFRYINNLSERCDNGKWWIAIWFVRPLM